MSDPSRIDELEAAIMQLRAEVGALRDLVRVLAAREAGVVTPTHIVDSAATAPAPSLAASAPPFPAAPPAPDKRLSGLRDRRTTSAVQVEGMVGRYFTFALAALLILMAAGVFVSWAYARIQLGPVTRVALGALGAGVVAGVGWYLRRRGARSFGNTLLALALGIIHVDAWGAGPTLHLISSSAALGVAAVASLALAALAWTVEEQALFIVGVGGALVAPYVTTDGRGDIIVFLTYGWLVIGAAVIALRARDWPLARRLLAGGVTLYAMTAVSKVSESTPRITQNAATLFALACAAAALILGKAGVRGRLARALLFVSLIPMTVRAAGEWKWDVASLAAAAMVMAYIAFIATPDESLELPDGESIALPLLTLVIALVAIPDAVKINGALLALFWAAMATLAAWRLAARRGAHLLVAGVTSAYAIPAAAGSFALIDAGSSPQLIVIVALAVHSAIFATLLQRVGSRFLFVPVVAALSAASVWSAQLLEARPLYGYAPFLTRPSLVTAAVVAAWGYLSWRAQAMNGPTPLTERERGAVISLGPLALLLWGWTEWRRAFSLEMSTFLVILYIAAFGVSAIWLGRTRRSAGARRAGLALAVLAALRAVYQASDIGAIWLRIGIYLLVGCFLLGVAYWYRDGRGTDGELEPIAAPAQP